MRTIVIDGGRPLFGRVAVSGSKNAALPIIFSTVITRGVSLLHNVPDIGDVRTALDIIQGLGAKVTREGSDLFIDTRRLVYSTPSASAVAKIRASTYLLGATLSRFGTARIQPFGGCNFCDRPIDLHLLACRTFGAAQRDDTLYSHGLIGATLKLPKPSVGATVNSLILAAAAHGASRIEGYAREPHIFNLIDYLRSAGAEISITEDAITLVGGELSGGEVTVEGDPIEAGTYAALSAFTGGEVTVTGISPTALEPLLSMLSESGVSVDLSHGIRLSGTPRERIHITAEPYPGFPTDLQPIASVLLALGCGGTVEDRVWQGRFGYLAALAPFGVQYKIYPSGAEIFPSSPHAGNTVAPDLRGGAAALLLALFAGGESRIGGAEIIERGYEKLEAKLRPLGANIKIE